MANRNSERKELILGLNSFNRPAEASGKDAWVKLILNLFFMRKGTIPSEPEMGGELDRYEYSFIDDVKNEIRDVCMGQVQTYLPDIPLTNCEISSSTLSNGQSVMVIMLTFRYTDGEFDTVAVAAEKSSNQINFAVVM